jgi:hypothetical protein
MIVRHTHAVTAVNDCDNAECCGGVEQFVVDCDS